MKDPTERPDLSPAPFLEGICGTILTVEFEGLQGRFASTLAGLTAQGELMVRVPHAVTIRHAMHKGDTIVVRYAHDGTIFGFRTRVLSHALRPFPVMILECPTEVGTMRLRQADRVPCLIPATASLGDRTLNGMILDLSRSGCRFACEPEAGESLEFETDKPIELRFPLFRMEERQAIPATIRSLSVQDGAVRIGVEFGALAPAVTARLEAYIASVIDFLDEQAA